MYSLFDILVGGLSLFCIHHIDIMVFLHGAGASLHLVGVIDQNQRTARKSLIIAAHIHQLVSGAVDVPLRKAAQLLPGKYDVVSVHQKIFLTFGGAISSGQFFTRIPSSGKSSFQISSPAF